MPVPAPAPGQPVYDTRDGRTGHLTAVPSPHSPFVHVRWDDDEGPDMVMSLEHLAYGRPQADFTPAPKSRTTTRTYTASGTGPSHTCDACGERILTGQRYSHTLNGRNQIRTEHLDGGCDDMTEPLTAGMIVTNAAGELRRCVTDADDHGMVLLTEYLDDPASYDNPMGPPREWFQSVRWYRAPKRFRDVAATAEPAPITPATHRFHITAPDGTVIAGANSYEWAIAMAGGFTHDAGAEHTVIDTAAADAAGIALAYVRSHLSQREARVLATDEPARIEFTDTVSAYLGDHHKLEDVAYAELCDVASEAVTAFIAAGYEAREQGPAYTPGESRLAERIYGLLPGESPAAPEAGTARTHDPEPPASELMHAHGIEYRMGVFHQGWRAACACGFLGVWHLEDERGARREMAEHLLATRTPALDVADAMLERIPSRSQVEAIRARYFDDPFTDDATYGKLIEEALASDDAAEFAAEAASSDQALEAEWQAERLMQDRMMGGHE